LNLHMHPLPALVSQLQVTSFDEKVVLDSLRSYWRFFNQLCSDFDIGWNCLFSGRGNRSRHVMVLLFACANYIERTFRLVQLLPVFQEGTFMVNVPWFDFTIGCSRNFRSDSNLPDILDQGFYAMTRAILKLLCFPF